MSIVLAEVQSLNINLPDSVEKQDIQSDEFSDLMKSSLEDIPVDDRQVAENKELNTELSHVEAIDEAVMPLSWVSYLSTAEITVTTDSEPVTINIAGSTKPVSNGSNLLIGLDNTLPSLVAGEALPADGKVLPPTNESTGKLALAGVSHSSQQPGAPVVLAAQFRQESEARESQQLNLARGESQLSALEKDQSSLVNLDKLVESVSSKALEIQPGLQVLPDTALARQLVITPVGALTSLQASGPLVTHPDPLNIMSPNNPEEWSQGLGDRVSWMINQKLNSASIRLDPPSLGKLEIHIRVTDDATNVTINTQSTQTRELIDNASARLRDVLQEAGYQNVNVDVGHDRDQSRSDDQQIARESGESGSGTEAQLEASENTGFGNGRFFRPNALVDFFA